MSHCLFFCRLKINHDSDDFILEFGTVANKDLSVFIESHQGIFNWMVEVCCFRSLVRSTHESEDDISAFPPKMSLNSLGGSFNCTGNNLCTPENENCPHFRFFTVMCNNENKNYFTWLLIEIQNLQVHRRNSLF
jgi:hypothetical protein